MSLSRRIARPLLASSFFLGAANALRNAPALAPKAAPVTQRIVPVARQAVPALPSDPETLVRLNAAVQLLAAAALATGRSPRLSAAVLAGSLVPTTVAGHAFWAEETVEGKRAQRLQFVKNLSVVGGLLIAAGDTDGRPGVPWRARHAAHDLSHDVKREARSIKRAAKQEARLRKAQAKAALS
ncbi:DoxX family membrane protein [Nocardioides sp. TRM66260-LWL]|uniref:DoxX family membrane protein n=1 Tax=Nocardioides sp. TRM66260-LWL TaxID=2874478 RepID=UPI001CC59E21|nr:DoxX family membrane protein [Nocardioides sp. TRM66260-LWL]MBZ5734295.1 DoxX family membrane protein [Nocardioides sp. TRM66260-LWL]